MTRWQRRRALRTARADVQRFLRGLLDEPVCYFKNPGNAGDSLIHSGTVDAFKRAGIRWDRVEPGDDVAGRTVIMGGGGNFMPIYDHVDRAFNAFIETGARRIVILPHGIRGHDATLGRARPGDIFLSRDRPGLEHVRRVTSAPTVLLAHDMAFHLDVRRFMGDRSLAIAARPGLHDRLADSGWSLEAIADRTEMQFTRIDTERGPISPDSDVDISFCLMSGESDLEAAIASWRLLECIRHCRRIVTDRLHVAIASALTGVECELLPNSYDKNSAVYQQSLWMFPNINFRKVQGLEIDGGG